jgi:hypothetical protein
VRIDEAWDQHARIDACRIFTHELAD